MEHAAYVDTPLYPTSKEGTTPFAQLDDVNLEETGALPELKTHAISLHVFVQEWLQSQQLILERASHNIREQKSLVAAGGYIEEDAVPLDHQGFLGKFDPAEWQPLPALQTQSAKTMSTARAIELDDLVRRTLSALDDIREQMRVHGEEEEDQSQEPGEGQCNHKELKVWQQSFSKLSTTSGTDFETADMASILDRQDAAPIYGHSTSETTKAEVKPTFMKRLVSSKKFESLCCFVIFGNAIFMGYASDYAMSNLDAPQNLAILQVELLLCIFYTLEVMIRFCAHGRDYLCGCDWKWNIFDMVLVIFAVYDQFETFLAISHGFGTLDNMSFLRIMRLMKMLKLLRMVRLIRMFKELRLILNSVMGSVKSMCWSMVLIITISYMFGICFLQACTSALNDKSVSLSVETLHGVRKYWGSVAKSMHSLYLVSTSGEDWAIVAKPLWEVGGLFYLPFMIYIAFFLFVVVNTLTSLFVELTIANSDQDTQLAVQMELEKKDLYLKRLQAFFDTIDNNQDGSITYEEFCTHLNDPEVRAFASSLEIEVIDTKQVFCILSNHGTNAVDLEAFVVGCIKLRGMAKSMDLMDLMYAHKNAVHEQHMFAETCLERLQNMELLLQGRQKPCGGVKRSFKGSSIKI